MYASCVTLKPQHQPNNVASGSRSEPLWPGCVTPAHPSFDVKPSALYLTAMQCIAGGHWFFLPGINCWQMGKWVLPKQDMAQVAISIRQVARLLRTLHDTFAEASRWRCHSLPSTAVRPCDLLCCASHLAAGIVLQGTAFDHRHRMLAQCQQLMTTTTPPELASG